MRTRVVASAAITRLSCDRSSPADREPAPRVEPSPAATSTPVDSKRTRGARSADRTTPAAPGALSPRNANYDIDVRLDHAARTLTGTEIIRWRNIGRAPADSLRLHLYWNAWRNTASTWMRERALAGDDDDHAPRGLVVHRRHARSRWRTRMARQAST